LFLLKSRQQGAKRLRGVTHKPDLHGKPDRQHACVDVDLNAAGLSFIGLGVRPPTAEWGIMVAEGAGFMVSGEWWIALFPGLALMIAVFCFNLLGDGLRDIVDPQRRT